MNLAATISIYSGGPGSGCQGPNCGRKVQWSQHPDVQEHKSLFKKVGGRVLDIALDKLKPSESFDNLSSKKVAGLKKSIEKGEAIPPLAVGRRHGVWEVEDGHHRYAALKSLGKKTVKAIYIPRKTADKWYDEIYK